MQAYVGAIFSFGFNFAPYGWFLCDGRSLSIAQYQVLYSLLGTTYGGDGVNTFNIPSMKGRTPIGCSLDGSAGPGLPAYALGQVGGSENCTLTTSNLPPHNHQVLSVTLPATSNTPANQIPVAGNLIAASSFANGFNTVTTPGVTMAPSVSQSGVTGSNIPFSILNPYNTVNYCICNEGLYPQRN